MNKKVILPTGLGLLCVPGWDPATHILDMEQSLLKLARGDYRKLMISIPIRHGKSMMANLFIAWWLISRPESRILRVMASATTAEMEALEVLRMVETWGPKLNGVVMDKRKCAAAHFKTSKGGELRSIGVSGDVESWTFNLVVIDDALTDPYEVRSFNRREQIYKDLNTKFLSRVDPMGRTKFLYIGSRRHPTDPQGKFLEADRQQPDPNERWHYHHRPAIYDEGMESERALWPTSREFNLEGLKRLRDEKIANGVAFEWASLFMNDPTGSPDTLAFDPKWFRPENIFYDFPSEALPPAKFKVLATDPSMGAGNEWNDFFASVYMHIADDSTIYVDDSYLAVAKPDAIVPMMTAFVGRHQNMDIAPFEANSGGLYAAELIKRACDAHGYRFPVIFKTYTCRSEDEKVSRITLNLFEILSASKLKLRDTPMNRQLYAQLQQFPTGKLDGPDALATGIITLKDMLK